MRPPRRWGKLLGRPVAGTRTAASSPARGRPAILDSPQGPIRSLCSPIGDGSGGMAPHVSPFPTSSPGVAQEGEGAQSQEHQAGGFRRVDYLVKPLHTGEVVVERQRNGIKRVGTIDGQAHEVLGVIGLAPDDSQESPRKASRIVGDCYGIRNVAGEVGDGEAKRRDARAGTAEVREGQRVIRCEGRGGAPECVNTS